MPDWYHLKKNMIDEEKPRSIRFPRSLWNAIDIEAKRCKRSAVKQMESVLATYYGLDNVELDTEKLASMQGINGNTNLVGIKAAKLKTKKPEDKKKTG